MRTIKGYEGYYHFDDKMNIVNTKTGFIKRPCVSSCNYLVIDLFRDGIRKTLLVHRLIAENFIENPMGFPEVNHKDGNRKFLSGGVTQNWIDEFDKVVIGNIHDNPELLKGGEK